MNITITGSIGNTGKPLAKHLIAAGHRVRVITSNIERKAAIEALGAEAAIGSVNDVAFLTEAFTGADAVYAMTPPNMRDNAIDGTANTGKALAAAIKAAGVPRVVMLSSIGADLPAGNGPIAALHRIEQMYHELDGVAVTYLRAGYFYTNFYNDIPMIKGAGIIGANYPATIHLPLVHPEDIAAAAAQELQRPSDGKQIRYIISDVCTPGALAKALGAAIGKPELPWVEFSDEQSLQGMIQAGLPEEFAGLFTEMGAGLRNGSIISDFEKSGAPVGGSIKLEDFAREFASRF